MAKFYRTLHDGRLNFLGLSLGGTGGGGASPLVKDVSVDFRLGVSSLDGTGGFGSGRTGSGRMDLSYRGENERMDRRLDEGGRGRGRGLGGADTDTPLSMFEFDK